MRLPPSSLPPLDAATDDLLLCFSHLRWNFVHQRPQHLLTRAANDYLVWFIEEPLFEDGDNVPRMHVAPQPCGVVVHVPVLPSGCSAEERVALQRELLDELLAKHDDRQILTWYYTPMALQFSDHVQPLVCIYDCMDELSGFKFAAPELTAFEQKLFERADVVFTGGHSLYAAKRHQHRNCHAFPSAVDVVHFARARSPGTVEPKDQACIPHPRVGFVGVIDERMDIDLVGEAARLRPDWHFVMIGPVVKIDPAGLPQGANIHWIGAKSYTDLPRYLSGWDVGFMPFALNEATRFISPTKTPEFLAAGVPVVSTPIADVVRPYGEKGLVEIAATAQDVVAKADVLLARAKEPWLQRVDRHLAAGSWDKTWAAMNRLMTSALDQPAAGQTAYAAAAAE